MKACRYLVILAAVCLAGCTDDATITNEDFTMQISKVASSEGDTTLYTYGEDGVLKEVVMIAEHDFRGVSNITPVYANGKLVRLNNVHTMPDRTYSTHEEFEYEGNDLVIHKTFALDNHNIYRMFQYDSLGYTDGRVTSFQDKLLRYKMNEGVIDPAMQLEAKLVFYMDVKWNGENIDSMFLYNVVEDDRKVLTYIDTHTFDNKPDFLKNIDNGVFTLMNVTSLGYLGANNILTYRNLRVDTQTPLVEDTYEYGSNGLLQTIRRTVDGRQVTLTFTYEKIMQH